MDWTQVEERIVEDDRNKWDRKAAAEELRIVPDGLLDVGIAFRFVGTCTSQMCQRLGIPVLYCRRLPPELQAVVANHDFGRLHQNAFAPRHGTQPAQTHGHRAHRGQPVLHRGDGAGIVRRWHSHPKWPVKIARPLSQLRLPPTVQGVLASRIDRLPAEQKELLQTLAVIGRESLLGLVGKVSRTEAQLERMLGDLQAGEFIYEQPAVGDIEYTFKHALTQEVACNSLLIERRKLLHERIRDAIESLYASSLEDHLAELSNHYSRRDNITKAVEYLGRAGQQAMQRSAYPDAIGSLNAAADLLQRLPDSPERIQRELLLQLAVAPALMVVKGWASPEVVRAFARAGAL